MDLPKPMEAPQLDAKAVFAKLDADQREWHERATQAQAQAAHAYARLIQVALESDTGQAARVACFVAAAFNGNCYNFDLFELRALDVPISDDILVCIDALRWGRSDLYKLVPDGDRKVKEVIRLWNLAKKVAQDGTS